MRTHSSIQLVVMAICLATPLFAGSYWGIIGAVHGGVDALKEKIDAQGGTAVPTAPAVTATPVYSPTASPTVTPSFTPSPTFSASPSFTASPMATDSFTASPSPSPTPTVTETWTPSPLVQVLWQNGSSGCWAGNCAGGGIQIQDAVFWSTYTTVSNAMRWTVTVGGFNYFEPKFTLQNAQDQSAYANGHLQFDVKLAQPAANYSAITIFAMGGTNMSLDLATVNSSSFTTVSFPLATLGTNGTGLMSTQIQFTSVQGTGADIIYFNNIEWVSN